MSPYRGRHSGATYLIRAAMAAAVGLEIDAWAPRKVASMRVGPGRASAQGVRVVHQFRRLDLDEPPLREGTTVVAELAGMEPMAATLVEADSAEVAVAFHQEVPPGLPPGRLVEDPRWIQRALQRELLSDLPGRRDKLAMALFGLPVRASAPRRGRGRVPEDINPEQRIVVEQAVRGGVIFVSAGPGTGKTRTISAVAQTLLAEEGRTLVVAPSNQAADEAAMAICSRVAHLPDFRDGLLIRSGNPRSPQFIRRYGFSTDPFRIALRRLGGTDAQPSPSRLSEEMDGVVQSARVLVATTVQPFLARAISGQRFETVILDEAAMTSLPVSYLVGSLAERTLLLLGDPLQLPAVVRSPHPVARAFYKPSAFSTSGTTVFPPSAEPTGMGSWVTLSTQYRMDPPVQALVNHLTYEGRLTVSESVLKRRPLRGPARGAPLILVDTSDLGAEKGGRRGFANPAHARLASRVVHWLETGTADAAHSIAVLARFREQVTALSREIPGESGAQVSTVHGIQGGEVDTVVLDLSAAPGSYLGDYLTDTTRESDGGRLLTVALSRARRRIVLMANVHLLLNHPEIPSDAVARRLLDYFIREGIRLEPEQLDEPAG